MFITQLEDITESSVKDIANFFTDFHKYSKSGLDHSRVYLSSPGGDYGSMQAIRDILNLHKSSTTVVAYNEVCSAAFELFFTTECKKEIVPGTVGMFHMATTSVDMKEDGSLKKDENIKLEFLTWSKEQTKEICKNLQMTRKARTRIFSGEDVYFTYPEMLVFLEIVQPK